MFLLYFEANFSYVLLGVNKGKEFETLCNMVCIYFNNSLRDLIIPTSSLLFSLVIWTGYLLHTYLIHLLLIYVSFVILVCEHAFHLLWGRSK